MRDWIFVIIAIVIMLFHEKISASKYWFLGGLVPLAGAAALIYQVFILKEVFSTKLIITYVIFFVVTLLLWALGRYEYRQKEISKMKAKDI